MAETTFLDALDYCEVHGHDIEFVDMTILDMIGNMCQLEKCNRCGKKRETVMPRPDGDLRTAEMIYPDGKWR